MKPMAIKRPQNVYLNLLTVDGFSLTKARCGANLRGEDLAQLVDGNLNKSTISRWERNQLTPSSEHLFKLVEILGTYSFVRLNGKAVVTKSELEVIRSLRDELVVKSLNGKVALTQEEIEVVRKLREG